MKRIGETQLQRIIRKTGRKPIQCKCKQCQQQCHTPCLGTPQDILKLIKAGYADRLSWTDWAAGIIMGCTDHVVGMVQATADGDWCTFYHDGLCELHDKGLKFQNGLVKKRDIIEEMPCGALDYYRKDAIAETKAKAVEVLRRVMEKYETSKHNINVIVNEFEREIKKGNEL